MTTVAVIGAGLFGRIISARLRADGHQVTLYDAEKPGSGSKPAACLMKPSWFSGAMGRRESEEALLLLDALYGVQDLEFTLRPTRGQVTVHWVDPARILGPWPTIHATVDRIIAQGGGSWLVSGIMEDKRVLPRYFTKVIVAAGVWCNDILVQERGHELQALHVPGLTGRAGSAFLFKRMSGPSFIAPWAPYKQIVAFPRGDGYWVGDGQSIKPENWTPDHSEKSRLRVEQHVGEPAFDDEWQELHGLRPYVPNVKPCYLQEHHEGVWVCTGGAKNGTIAAAWAANELARRLS